MLVILPFNSEMFHKLAAIMVSFVKMEARAVEQGIVVVVDTSVLPPLL